jgi:hypothetical protein
MKVWCDEVVRALVQLSGGQEGTEMVTMRSVSEMTLVSFTSIDYFSASIDWAG